MAIELTMTSLARKPGIKVAPACHVPKPDGATKMAKKLPIECKKLSSTSTLNPPGPE